MLKRRRATVTKHSNLSFVRRGNLEGGGDVIARGLWDEPGMTAAGGIELLSVYSALRDGVIVTGYHGHDLALGSIHASRGVL